MNESEIEAEAGGTVSRDLRKAWLNDERYEFNGQRARVVGYRDRELWTLQLEDVGGPSVVKTIAGTFHTATGGHPRFEHIFAATPGAWKRIRLSFMCKMGPWSDQPPSGLHNLFWLVINGKNFDQIGYGNIYAPPKNRILMRHGIAQTNQNKARVETSLGDLDGWIRVRYDWDLESEVVFLTLDRESLPPSERQLTSVPNISEPLVLTTEDNLVVHCGFTGSENPNEPASIGWQWADLRLELNA